MANAQDVRGTLSLEDFLRLPGIDQRPYREFIDGRVEVKVSPQRKHGAIQGELVTALNLFARATKSGRAFPELRCTFARRSIVPDVAFLLREHIALDEQGEVANETLRPPDIHVEIGSPEQSLATQRKRLVHSTANGCLLGVLIDPQRKTIDVFRPGESPRRLGADEVIDATPVLRGFRLAVSEIFGWLRLDP